MCGSLQIKIGSILSIRPSVRVPKEFIFPEPKVDLPFSDNRFIKSERVDWWASQVRFLKRVEVACESFNERGINFAIPKGMAVIGEIHTPLFISKAKWVISIFTVDPSRVKYLNRYHLTELDEITKDIIELGRQVAKIHHRMPLIGRSSKSA